MYLHAMALGYFFLATFCLFVSANTFVEFCLPLLIAALAAMGAGLGFLMVACSAQLQASKQWLKSLWGIARQAPVRQSNFGDEPSA
jgi:hypothetical protein